MSENRSRSVILEVGPVLGARLLTVFVVGWHVRSRSGGLPVRADLIVLDAARIGRIASIRAMDYPGRYAAIVVAGGASSPIDPSVDDVLPGHPTAGDVAALAARWTPLATPALDRLSAAFGRVEVVALAAGLRDQLDDVIPALAMGAQIDAAHRLAGLSGMLGFDELGRHWSALSDGAAVDRRALRIATRQAIVALDRFVTGVASPACAPACADGDPAAAPPPKC